jgi:hypothetical protein
MIDMEMVMFTAAELSLAYASYKGPVVVAKMAKPRPSEKTFRNNKYSIYNIGRVAAAVKSRGMFATIDRI